MKQLAILGSTGSIGCNTLKIVEKFPLHFGVQVLTAKNNIKLLAQQVKQFAPEIAVTGDQAGAVALKTMLPNSPVTVLHGESGYTTAAAYEKVDTVVTAVVGAAGLAPTLAAIDAGKTIALANKETLVMAGSLVIQRATSKGINIFPVDSEHSAIFQCLAGQRRQDLHKIYLTASGGPFFNRPADTFANIQVEDALNHPTWKMGPKISIDSATMMNKGLEVIEAAHLFGVPVDTIEVLVHPQSIVHSMVSYKDGAVIAQLGIPDMRGAIAYAVSWPERLPLGLDPPNFADLGRLTFQAPDFEKFPCLKMAYQAGRICGTMPAVLNAANEVAVEAFLKKRISFDLIPLLIEEVMQAHIVIQQPELNEIYSADQWARTKTKALYN